MLSSEVAGGIVLEACQQSHSVLVISQIDKL